MNIKFAKDEIKRFELCRDGSVQIIMTDGTEQKFFPMFVDLVNTGPEFVWSRHNVN